MSKKLTNEEVINQFKLKHGSAYDYSLVNYVSTYNEVTIICKEHGEFKQAPITHKRGSGCPKCGLNKTHNTTRWALRNTDSDIIKLFKETHGDLYNYSKVIYNGYHSKVTIICKEHGEFKQHIAHHKNGHGCPNCNNKHLVWYKDKQRVSYKHSVYLIHVKDDIYKIGYTSRSVEERVLELSETLPLKIIKVKHFKSPYEALSYERRLHNRFIKYKINMNLLYSGNTELFNFKPKKKKGDSDETTEFE